MRILLVEQRRERADAVDQCLRKRRLAVDRVTSLVEAFPLVSESAYDCLVLDRDPGDDPAAAVQKLRAAAGEERYLPVIVVSARRTSPGERIAAFEAGADDYLDEPFVLDELACRVLALCRRVGRVVPPVLEVGDVVLDASLCAVYEAGVPLALTAKEYAVLELLMRRAGEVVTRAELVEHCWGERESPFSNVVDVHIASLRRKLASPEMIRTRRGTGYALEPPAGGANVAGDRRFTVTSSSLW